MAVYNATKKKTESAGTFKATEKKSVDSSMIYGWEKTYNESYDTLEKFRKRIEGGEYLSSDDLSAYENAMNSYVGAADNMRFLSKSMGKNDIDDKEWESSVSQMRDNFKAVYDHYSRWDTKEKYDSAVAAGKEYEDKKNLDIEAAEQEIENWESAMDRYGEANSIYWRDYFATEEDRQAAIDKYNSYIEKYGSEKEMTSAISERRAYIKSAQYIQDGIKLASAVENDDFAENSKYVSTAVDGGWDKLWSEYSMGYGDLTYEYINGDADFRNEVEKKHVVFDKNALDSEYKNKGYDLLEENEIAIYNYYYAKEGKEAAQKYLDSIQGALNERKANAMFSGMEGNTLLELAFGVSAGLDQFKSGMKGAWNSITGNDSYIPPSATQMASGMVREDLADDGFKFWYNFKEGKWEDKILGNSLGQVAYDSTTTTANMLPSILTSVAIGAISKTAGTAVAAKAIASAGQVAGAGLLGTSAAGNAYQEMVNLGYNKQQAGNYAALVGASEAGLQYLLGGISKVGGKLSGNAISKIVSGVDNAFARTAIKLGGSMLSEGFEEGLQEILTPWLQNLALNTDEDANWNDVAYSSLLGALTAGFMEGGGTIATEVGTYRTGKSLQAAGISGQRLAEIGQTFSADSVAYKLAGKVNENTGAYTLGRLFNEIGAELTEANKAEIAQELEKRGVSAKDARVMVDAMANVVLGGSFTDKQIAILEANDVLTKAVVDVVINPNSTVNQRSQGYKEILSDLVKQKDSNTAQTEPVSQSGENAIAENTVSAETETASQGDYEAAVEGKTIRKSTGEAVNIKEVASVDAGKMTLRLEDGSEVEYKELAYSSTEEAYVFETVANLGVDAKEATRIINAFRNSGVDGKAFADGMRLAFEYGYGNFSQQELARMEIAGNIPQMYINTAYEIGQKMRKKETNGGVQYSLRMFEKDGRRYVEIDQDQDRFNGHSVDEYPRIAKDIINEKFNGKIIGMDNKMFVNGSGRDEFANPSKHISGGLYEAKMRSAGEIDNLLDAGTNYRKTSDGADGHFHPDVIDGFDHFDTLFKIGNRYYEAVVNIKNIKRGKLFKDVTKIKDVTQDVMSSYGQNPKSQFLRTSSTDSIRNPGKTVNKKVSGKARGVYYTTKDGKAIPVDQAEKNGKLALKDKQSVAVKTAKFLQKLGVGSNYYFFESYVDQNGRRVFKDRFGNTQAAPNGLYYSDGDIYIDINAGTDSHSITLRTLSHELTHMIQQWSAAKYKAIADFLAEQYGKEGRNAYEAAKAKQTELSELRGKRVSFQEAYHEFVADSMSTMFDDGNLYDILADLKKKDKTIFDYIKKFFDGLAAKVRNLYANTQAETDEGQFVQGLSKETVYRLQQMFADALVDAGENYAASEQKNTDSEIGVQYSVTAEMTDAERYDDLKDKSLAIIRETRTNHYSDEVASLEELKKKAKSKAEKIIYPLAEKLGITQMRLVHKDIDVEFVFSKNRGLKESLSKQLRYGGSYADFAKALINLDRVLESAILIEVHKDKYAGTSRADKNIEAVFVLLGAFQDGTNIIPVQMEIKKSSDVGGRLYMTVALTKIEADVLGSTKEKDQTRSLISASIYSLADIVRKINPEDAHFLKYLPDKMLSAAQIEAKSRALAEDVQRIEGYRMQGGIQNQDRTEIPSNRAQLAQALEGVAANMEDYQTVQEYRQIAPLLDAEEAKLSRLNAQIREMTFGKGSRDREKLVALRLEAKQTQNRIDIYDRQLLKLEAAAPIRRVLEREKTKAYKKAAEKGKEAVRKEKENAQAKYKELAEKNAAARKKGIDSRERTEMRHKIRKAVRDLDKLLNRGNKKLNVKEDMKGFVSKSLELAEYLFTDHISNDDLIRKGITVRMTPKETALVKETEDILSKLYDKADSLTDEEFTRLDAKRKANEDKLRNLLTAQRNERLNTPVYNLFNDLATEYANLKNSNQDAVKAAYDPNVERFLRSYIGESDGETDSDRKTLLQNMRVADMTTDELWKLYNAYKMVLHSVRNANERWVKGKTETIEQTAGRIMDDFSKRKIPDKKLAIIARNITNKIGWDYEKLYYALDRIGSEAFTELVMNIADSENIVMQDVGEARAFLDEVVEKYGFNSWDVNKEIDREFLDNNGKKFKLTLGELMSLYAYSRRTGAWDHIEYGGFVFGEAALTNPRPADSYKLSKEQCEAITSLLTKEQKGYVEDMQKFLSETMGAKGNEVSMLLYGIKMFGEKNYFPIHIAGQFKAQAQESQAKAAAGFGTMSNAGFTHSQNPNAKAPFVLEGFNEIWVDHINEMSRYHGAVPALEDMRRVMNRSSYSESGMDSMAIKQLMENNYGKEAVEYFDSLYREANSGAITDKLQKKSHKLLSLFRKNSVAYSLSVLIQQPASLVRAYAMIDRKYFGVKGFGAITSGIAKAVSDKWTKAHTNAYNEMLKYAPGVTMAKEIGGFDTHTGMSIRSYLLDTGKKFKQKWKTGTAKEKGKAILDIVDDNAIANLPNLADKIAWIEIWNACKRETVATQKNLTPNSEEFMQAVGDRFTEVIRATQVYDSIFAKSPMLKSKNLFVQMVVSFMNEPNTVANMAEKAVRDAIKGNWKDGLRTGAVVIHSIIFTNVLKSIIYAMRDDDEDETYIEKYIESITGCLMDDFNALNYIPVARDAWSLAQGYDVERADMAIVADALDAIEKVIKNANTDKSDMTEEDLIEFDKKVTEASWKLVESMASFFGIPVRNIRREINGVIDSIRITSANAGQTTAQSTKDTIYDAIVESIPFMSNKKSKGDKLYDAIVNGDGAYVDRLKSGYKDESSYRQAVRKALRENDSRIKEAAEAKVNGDSEEYLRLAKEIIAEKHFVQDDVVAAINAEINALLKAKKSEAQ